MSVAMLSGGVGGGRMLAGLAQVVGEDLTAIVNTGDDALIQGLHICPDVDSVLYHLAGTCDWERGWGVGGDTFTTNRRYVALADAADAPDVDMQEWFGLGDIDLATHLFRTRLLGAGLTLSAAIDVLRRAMGVVCTVVPMSDQRVATKMHIRGGTTIDFEDYFVRLQHAVDIESISFEGADGATPSPGAVEALASADVVGLTPSNPLVSIGPILAVPGYREALAGRSNRFAVSPIVGGKALKGPAAVLLQSTGHEPTAIGVARIYEGLVDMWVIDESDAGLAPQIRRETGARVVVCDTVMRSADDSARLARFVLDSLCG